MFFYVTAPDFESFYAGTSRRLLRYAPPGTQVAEPPGEEHVMLVKALQQLPVDQRRALALHYLLDRSIADIAAETGANINTVKSWLARGRTNLATALGGDSDVR